MARSATKNFCPKYTFTVAVSQLETAEKIIQLVQDSGQSTNKVLNALLDYAAIRANVGSVQTHQTGIVFDDDRQPE